jgi:guanylate kinase
VVRHAESNPGLLIVLCGPSGVGKSTISRELAEKHSVSYIVSATTRPRREGDDKGTQYQHISKEEFFRRLEADEFLEYAQNYDDYYGTPKHPALDLLAQGKDILLEIDVQGALQVRFQYPQCLMIFILPPDEPILLQRLQGRARDSAEDIAKRFRDAKREIHMAKGSRAFDYMVINDELERAVTEILKIIRHKRSGGF